MVIVALAISFSDQKHRKWCEGKMRSLPTAKKGAFKTLWVPRLHSIFSHQNTRLAEFIMIFYDSLHSRLQHD